MLGIGLLTRSIPPNGSHFQSCPVTRPLVSRHVVALLQASEGTNSERWRTKVAKTYCVNAPPFLTKVSKPVYFHMRQIVSVISVDITCITWRENASHLAG